MCALIEQSETSCIMCCCPLLLLDCPSADITTICSFITTGQIQWKKRPVVSAVRCWLLSLVLYKNKKNLKTGTKCSHRYVCAPGNRQRCHTTSYLNFDSFLFYSNVMFQWYCTWCHTKPQLLQIQLVCKSYPYKLSDLFKDMAIKYQIGHYARSQLKKFGVILDLAWMLG